MIIDCISDLHGEFPELSGGDLLIIAGDLTTNDTPKAWMNFYEWLDKQEYKKKIYISGNHDNFLVNCLTTAKAKLLNLNEEPEDREYLCDEQTEFEDLKIWGSPWSPWFHGVNPHCKAFMGSENDLKKKYDLIPNDIDILITHGPPMHVLDKNNRDISCGSYQLREALERIRPMLHVFGHIHEQGDKQLIFKHAGLNTICVNASIMDENYDPVNKPIRIIL